MLFVTTPVLLFTSLRSSQSRDHYRAGRYVEAEYASKDSLYFNKIGFAIGIVVNIVAWALVLISVVIRIVFSLSDVASG